MQQFSFEANSGQRIPPASRYTSLSGEIISSPARDSNIAPNQDAPCTAVGLTEPKGGCYNACTCVFAAKQVILCIALPIPGF
jgi:hypothetical protein